MRKSSIISAIVLFVAAIMLSGCILPYGDDDGGGHRERHEHHEGGYHEGEHHEGGERR
jgi:hypothetical protein